MLSSLCCVYIWTTIAGSELPDMWSYGVLLPLFLTASVLGVPWTEAPASPGDDDGSSPGEGDGPYFERSALSVRVRPGQAVMLPCRVRRIADKIVSWIRRRDLHILTSASVVFTADDRWSLLRDEGDSAAWTLRLVDARPSDSGLYECQVNTEPKLKRAVTLTVSDTIDDFMEQSMGDDASTVGAAIIQGPREQYVRMGSTWTLTCEVSGLPVLKPPTPSPPLDRDHRSLLAKPTRLVDWLHEGKLLTYQSTRGGVSVDTERSEGLTVSRLTLAALTAADTGRYSCKPLSLPPAVVTLIVVEGEKTAMLGRNLSQETSPSWLVILVLSLLNLKT